MKPKNTGFFSIASIAVPILTIGLVAYAQDTNPDRRAGSAYAEQERKDDANDAAFRTAFSSFKLPLAQAISTAESQAKGKAYKAKVTHYNMAANRGNATDSSGTTTGREGGAMGSTTSNSNVLVAEVCVIANDMAWTVIIDENGKVLSTTEKKGHANTGGEKSKKDY